MPNPWHTSDPPKYDRETVRRVWHRYILHRLLTYGSVSRKYLIERVAADLGMQPQEVVSVIVTYPTSKADLP